MFIGAFMIALGISLGLLGFLFYRTAEVTRARLDSPVNFSRDNDRMAVGELDRVIKACAIVGGTFVCLGVFVLGSGRRMNQGWDPRVLTISE